MDPLTPDLNDVSKGKGWKGTFENARLTDKDGAPAIEFNTDDFLNVVWLDDFVLTNGTIEFDAKGKNQPAQNGFFGVSFRVKDETTHDAVYFRAFNFGSEDLVRRSHAVQYISHPDWPWHRLREEKPDQYEQPINPDPDGDDWFHVTVILNGRMISVHINDAKEPSLVVAALSNRGGGSVGLWCYGYGVIANLEITPAE